MASAAYQGSIEKLKKQENASRGVSELEQKPKKEDETSKDGYQILQEMEFVKI